MRILVQFIGQGVGRHAPCAARRPDMPRPYRIWLYPIPTFIALVGWTFIFLTTNVRVIGFGLAILALGGRRLPDLVATAQAVAVRGGRHSHHVLRATCYVRTC